MKNILVATAAAFALSAAAGAASASPVVLTFEGIADETAVGNFYSGLGVTFSPDTLALVDQDAGGTGNFANEPTPNTIMFFLNSNNAVLNYAAGFTTGFSFYYTSSTAATINVYDDVDAGGNLLASINISAQYTDNCSGDPTGGFCNFTPVGVAFSGTAKSIDFGGTANQTGYDNITFGSDTPGTGSGAPEPATWALMIGGMGLAGAALRRRRSAAVAA